MSALTRGFRNVYRNQVRTGIVIIILSLSIAVFLTMIIVDEGVNEEIESVETSVGTDIQVRPAGSFGGFSVGKRPGGSGQESEQDYLDESIIPDIRALDHVDTVDKKLTQMDFEMRALITGIETDAPLAASDGSIAPLIEGTDLSNYSSSARVAIVSHNFTEDNGVGLGDNITINGTEFKIIGIFASETRFGGRTIFMPILAAQRALELEDRLSEVVVTADSIENVDLVYDELRDVFDAEEVDVVHPGEENEDVIASLETIADNSAIGAVVALGIGCIIVFFIMMLVTRERRREIGTLKAIGASDGDVLKQFMIEAMTIAIIGAAIGLLIASVGGNAIADTMVGEDESNNDQTPDWLTEEQTQRFKQMQGERNAAQGDDTNEVLSSISYSFSLVSIVYAFGAAIIIGGLGILYPAVQASRMTPVEALRDE